MFKSHTHGCVSNPSIEISQPDTVALVRLCSVSCLRCARETGSIRPCSTLCCIAVEFPGPHQAGCELRRCVVQEREPRNQIQPPPTAVGVTNPYFLRAFEHCPHVMTIMHEPSALTPGTSEAPHPSQVQPGMLSTLFTASGSFHPDLLAGKLDSLSMQRGLLCSGQDRSLLLKVKTAMDTPSTDAVVAACHVLRNHFHHLTVSFLLVFYDFLERPNPWAATRQVQIFKAIPACANRK